VTLRCTYCRKPLPAPPLAHGAVVVCTPDGQGIEPACYDCYVDRRLYAVDLGYASEHKFHPSYDQGPPAEHEWEEWEDFFLWHPRGVAHRRYFG
jgi:hypothetical protein